MNSSALESREHGLEITTLLTLVTLVTRVAEKKIISGSANWVLAGVRAPMLCVVCRGR